MARKWESKRNRWTLYRDTGRKQGGGREGEEEESRKTNHPIPPYPIPPCFSNPSLPKKLSLWETGQVRMRGMSAKARHEDITHTVMSGGQRHTDGDGGGSGVDGLWLIDGSAATYTLEWVGIPLQSHLCKCHLDTKWSVLTQNSPIEMCNHICAVQKTTHKIALTQQHRQIKTNSKAKSGLWLRCTEKQCLIFQHYLIAKTLSSQYMYADCQIVWKTAITVETTVIYKEMCQLKSESSTKQPDNACFLTVCSSQRIRQSPKRLPPDRQKVLLTLPLLRFRSNTYCSQP